MDFKVVMTKTLQQAIMSKLKTTKKFWPEDKKHFRTKIHNNGDKKKKNL